MTFPTTARTSPIALSSRSVTGRVRSFGAGRAAGRGDVGSECGGAGAGRATPTSGAAIGGSRASGRVRGGCALRPCRRDARLGLRAAGVREATIVGGATRAPSVPCGCRAAACSVGETFGPAINWPSEPRPPNPPAAPSTTASAASIATGTIAAAVPAPSSWRSHAPTRSIRR